MGKVQDNCKAIIGQNRVNKGQNRVIIGQYRVIVKLFWAITDNDGEFTGKLEDNY